MNEEMMRERYESLPLSELRAVAKARGLKGISALRKEGLVQRMLEADREGKNPSGKTDKEQAAVQSGGAVKEKKKPQKTSKKFA